ncbi:RNA polymerase sigma factor [Luteolibacter yonseiensis]|uniref:RNA polymerase sigma factor n=1 Tax=Luteolibacter yonseiensis TaxID=1144680 RepID=A0A934VB23_9BACT|nr:RNA polymerase sigma factor [Luteolibacter yonseiensis]MBK1814959.1 RNA polymerase sigma factor [Luteolibacter yonseiensis]
MPANFPATEPPPDAGGAVADFSGIYETHVRAVYYLILRWLGDPSKAEDATHDVFLKAFRNLENFRQDSEIRTWLFRIAINHCKNLRSSWHQRNVSLTPDGEFTDGAAVDSSTPLQVAEARDLGRGIQQALDVLPEEYRLLLLCVADAEMSYDEIAILTNQSSDAVRGKIYRARKAFGTAFRQTTEP